ARRFEAKTQTMTDVTIVQMDGDQPRQVTYAGSVVWDGNTWYMTDGVVHVLGDDTAVTMSFGAGRQPVSIDQTPTQIAARQKATEEMSLKELKEHIAVLRSQ